MPAHLDLTLLRAFVAVAETGGMTAAGRHLNLTQAAVSQQIKRLEDQIGVELFDRRQRRLRLTGPGEQLIGHAERLLALNDEIWTIMTAPEAVGEIRLGVPHDLVAPFMPAILRGFAMSRPRVEVSLVCRISSELRRMIAAGEIDLTLTTEARPDPDGETLLADRLVWVGAPGGEAHTRAPLPVSLGDKHCAFRAAAVKALNGSRRDWRFICAISDMSALCATLEADLAVAPLLSQAVPDGLEIRDAACGLPPLPVYYINLYRRAGADALALELSQHISRTFAARYPQAA